mgnify:CR=1 FL=1
MSKTHRVEFSPLARRDLISLHDYIAAASGPAVARGYLDRIERACEQLSLFPERGTLMAGHAGVRMIGFERRATLVFRVARGRVEILRVLYGGRQSSGSD